MSVSDLTNTKWIFNSIIDLTNIRDMSYNINFSSNNQTYEILYCSEPNNGYYLQYQIGITIQQSVYSEDSTTWTSQAYRTIEITDGTDATNPDLIVWLMNNATYVEPQPQSSDNIYIGSLALDKVYLGSQEVIKIYLGSTLVYEDDTQQLVAPTIELEV